MIPKIIHYAWFGDKDIPDRGIKNLESFKKYCPDYEFKLWNEDNFDVRSYEFTKNAYELKRYAFVSDVVRLYAVYTEGGIYFDLGVEMFKPIDELVNSCDVFFAFQNEILITTGLGFGANKGNEIIKCMLEVYNNIYLDKNTKLTTVSCPKLNTNILVKLCPEIKINGKSQKTGEIKILSCQEYRKYFENIGFKSWVNDKDIIKNKSYKDTVLKRFLKREKIIMYCNNHKNIFTKTYLFLVYDFLEYGPLYYLKKVKK